VSSEAVPGGPITDDDARALALLLVRWATYELDQFDHWKVQTPHGPAYVQILLKKPPEVAEDTYTTIWPLPPRLRGTQNDLS
jgi:hypothetical protein